MSVEGPEHIFHGEEEASLPGAQVSLSVITRRRLLGYLSGLLGGLLAAALGLPLARFYVGNAFARQRPLWLELGPAAEVEPGQPRLFTVSHVSQDGWNETTARQEVYAVARAGDGYVVFSNVCTHLGCPVRWDDAARAFLCPCHGGAFGLDGRVLHGPPPRPLLQVPHKVERGVLSVRVGEG